jgi:hypothetical protein
MGNKTIPGANDVQLTVNTTRPAGEVGIDMTVFNGGARPHQWLITTEFESETTRASLDLATKTTHVDTLVKARYLGVEGNGVKIAFVGDSAAGEGLTIDDDLSTETATIHFETGISTVADLETALGGSALVMLKTAGTPGNVLVSPADAFTAAALIGGVDAATTTDIFVWGRESTSKRWGLHNDSYGRVLLGKIHTGIVSGLQHLFLKDLGNYDRVYFTRAGSTGTVTVRLTEIYSTGVGN